MKTGFIFCFLMLSVGFGFCADSPTLYAVMIQNKSAVLHGNNVALGLQRHDGDTTWTHLGWRTAKCFACDVHPLDHKTLYLACGNGVMKSLNGGRDWRMTTDWRMSEILDVAIDPLEPKAVYAATAYGIWRSGDAGDSWHAASKGIAKTFVQTIECDRERCGRLYAGGEGGLYVSQDGARSWSVVQPDNPVLELYQNPAHPQQWIAGCRDAGVLLSSDNGSTWSSAPGKISSETIYAVAIDMNNPNVMAAAGFHTGVYFSENGGRDWKRKMIFTISDVHALVFDPAVSGRIWAGTVGDGVVYSDDLGQTWQRAGLAGGEIWSFTWD